MSILHIHKERTQNNKSCQWKMYVYKHHVPTEYFVKPEMKSKLSIKVVMICHDYMVVEEKPIYSLNGSL